MTRPLGITPPHKEVFQLNRFVEAERLSQISQRLGIALWRLQELEGICADYLVLAAQAEKGMGQERGEALLEKARKNTFGVTLNSMGKADLFTGELKVRFERILSERNWMVHHSLNDSRGAVHDDFLMHRLVDRVDQITREASSLITEIGKLGEEFTKRHGATEEEISQRAAKILDRWLNPQPGQDRGARGF